jgi:hypothetical protein
MTTVKHRFVCALTSSLLCAGPGFCSAAKVRLYSDPYCGTFSAERTQSDARLSSFNVWSMRVESGAWYATVRDGNARKRVPAESDKAYTPEDGCVAFKERASSVADAQWLVYDACGSACRSELCMKTALDRDFRTVAHYVERLRDTGHVANREECLEQVKNLSSEARKKTASEVENCACECLPLHYALPPTAANRERVKSLQGNCPPQDGAGTSAARKPPQISRER